MDLAGQQNLSGKRIALGVCGGIAAYKSVELARRMTQAGADVRVVMTPSATQFVGPITFATLTGNPVRSELFPQTVAAEIIHTDLGRTSDLIVVAPATAKTIARYAQGLSDDLMAAMLLSAACPVLMAPAMHTEMWEDEATRSNVATLESRGVRFVGPDTGALAGPDAGPGRLADVSDIIRAAAEELSRRSDLAGVDLVVTAGGTREPIDAVRYIGNRSSGKMGFEIAREAVRCGAKVTLISAPTALAAPAAAAFVSVETAAEMHAAVLEVLERTEVLIMAAAVSDWRPVSAHPGKLSKVDVPLEIAVEVTPDILHDAGSRRSAGRLPGLKVLAGFCAETSQLEARARAKLDAKGLDLIVANEIGQPDSGFDSPTNRAIIIDGRGRIDSLPLLSKRVVARLVLDAVARILGETERRILEA